MPNNLNENEQQQLKDELSKFHGDGFFDWQCASDDHAKAWAEWHYDIERYWGGFSQDPIDPATYKLPDWAIGPFKKYAGNPIFSPDPNTWDCGHFGGGVHNGSILQKDGQLWYLYRGEFPIPDEVPVNTRKTPQFDYLCDVGLAVSDNGIDFTRVAGPLLRRPEDWMYSFEDVCCVEHDGKYYMFLNRWDWLNNNDPLLCGTYLAVSDDLINWEHKGLVFQNATRIHRNAAVLQDPQNRAVRDSLGRFVMYINNGLIAYSADMLHWESCEIDSVWPGGECAIAMAHYNPEQPDNLVLFTGGHHTGHFYALGEVLFSLKDPEQPLAWLPRSVLSADANISYEDGRAVAPPHPPVSFWRDTVFSCGMTLVNGTWYIYYGGSEYYTCLATAPSVLPIR
jgi:predicted GH43/DUF377 family glycosyl hydrolase